MNINDQKSGAFRRQSITPLTDYITANPLSIQKKPQAERPDSTTTDSVADDMQLNMITTVGYYEQDKPPLKQLELPF